LILKKFTIYGFSIDDWAGCYRLYTQKIGQRTAKSALHMLLVFAATPGFLTALFYHIATVGNIEVIAKAITERAHIGAE
jgi:hypothetical protein